MVGPDVLRRPDRRAARLLARRAAGEVALGGGPQERGGPRWLAAVREVADLEFVNGGGTGSLHIAGQDPVADRARRRLGAVRPDALRRLPRLPAAPRGGLRPAGGPAPRARHRHGLRRRLHRVGAAGVVAVAGGAVRRGGCGCSRRRAPARCRPRLRGGLPTAWRWATGCGSGTPRRGSSASASTSCTCVEGGQVVDRVPTYRGEAAELRMRWTGRSEEQWQNWAGNQSARPAAGRPGAGRRRRRPGAPVAPLTAACGCKAGGRGALVHGGRRHRRCPAAPRPPERGHRHRPRDRPRAGPGRHAPARAQPGAAGRRAGAAQPR